MKETATLRLLIPLALLASAATVAGTTLTFTGSTDGRAPAAVSSPSAPSAGAAAPTSGGRPVVVLVHGAWADTSSWSGEVRILRRAGYTVRAIGNPLENLTTDSRTVADLVRSIPGPVVLVGHSYGGSVITNAAAETGNVKALVYVDAAAPAVGETNGSLSGAKSALRGPANTLFDSVPYANAPAGASNLYLKQPVFVRQFANDLPVQQATDLWASQRAASTAAFDTPSKYAAWKTIPSWYFISSGDRIITPESQEMMAHRAGSKITVFPGGSHLTLISHPAAVAKIIESALRAVG
ncbi:alpha/beta hydrolase [Peterkaempfera griseoplana]|uniref:alpha/beta hydrolase n=1 Tax=Peterkaempfera griseoplana TaxID=66896 RepID=UPI00099EB567|nr:alpha/beta hydrolase [Peterkaempfera griseoplana]